MPAPANVSAFLDLVRKSGVVEEKRLDECVAKLRANKQLPDDIGALAGILVREAILTHFQAEQFLLGKWRRFHIGKYRVLERLGVGGMGSVYLCEHKLMRRRCAIKVLPTQKAEDPAALERFHLEARAVAALDHPNIVRAYDVDQDDKLHFLVMEYVDGSSLQEIIKKSGPMDPIRVAHYISQSAAGLDHAFRAAGLIHRDVKPGNVLVDRQGVVKILDMGLARFFDEKEEGITKKYNENVLGTADYLSPEQALDSHNVDIRTDIYSLGATMYFALTGRTPFGDGAIAQKLIWHQTKEPTPIGEIRPDVPPEMVEIVRHMMAKDREQRLQTPIDVVEALAAWTQEPIPPPSEDEMPRLSPAASRGLALATSTVPSPRRAGPMTPSPGQALPATPGPRQIPATPAPARAKGGVMTAPDSGRGRKSDIQRSAPATPSPRGKRPADNDLDMHALTAPAGRQPDPVEPAPKSVGIQGWFWLVIIGSGIAAAALIGFIIWAIYAL